MVEIYVPFSWYEPMWMENLGFAELGEGWKMTESGATSMEGDMPVNCSGGVLSSNPIGASGMIRFAEAALQVRGLAGEHQIDGARRARSATPTAAPRSTSRCGSSAPSRSEPGADPKARTVTRRRPVLEGRRSKPHRASSQRQYARAVNLPAVVSATFHVVLSAACINSTRGMAEVECVAVTPPNRRVVPRGHLARARPPFFDTATVCDTSFGAGPGPQYAIAVSVLDLVMPYRRYADTLT